jgi:hypothetical protein
MLQLEIKGFFGTTNFEWNKKCGSAGVDMTNRSSTSERMGLGEGCFSHKKFESFVICLFGFKTT